MKASSEDDARSSPGSVAPVRFRELINPSTWCLCGPLLLLLCTSAQAAAVKIEISGLSDELTDAARASLDLQKFSERSMTPTQIRRMFDRADDQIIEAMQPYGYYQTQVDSDLEESEKPDEYIATFEVTLGEPVVVTESVVRVQGDAAEIPEIEQAIEQFEPKVGQRLDHGAYENSKSMISTELQAQGYFDAELVRHRVEVLQSANSANIDVQWNSNRRYRFGEINFSDAQFPETFLQRYVPWKQGEYYSTQQLLLMQQRLVDADYFSAVSVQPDLQNAADDSVPIEVLLVRAKRTTYTADFYVSTDTGPGIRVGADRRWLNKRGHKIGGEIEYSQRLQEIGAYYRIPKPGLRNRNYNFGVGYRDEETDTSRSRMARLTVSEILDDWHGFTRTLGLQYLNGDFEIADQQQSTSLLYAEGTLMRKRANDFLFPTRGISVFYGVRLATEQLLSDTSLAQIRADAKWIRPVWEHGRLILRASVGAMTVDNFDALPPELRFFAGGDRSVRGFDHQAIGETDAQGGVIGGEYLTVISTEYEHYFRENWGAAVFVDAGDAYTDELDANVGAGVGIRWRSPVGLVRLDVAVPVVTDLEDGIRFHIVIGPDL